MLKQILPIIGASIFVLLGIAHLYYTFLTNKFNASDGAVTEGMKNTQPLLTRQTTIWNAWIGFNGSHSLGAIFFGIINIILYTQLYNFTSTSVYIQGLNVAMCLCYLFLAFKYWFKTPLAGIAVATVCFILGWVL